MSDPLFEPGEILRILAQHRVEFVVIGAFAAYLQGSPLPTLDVDICPRREEQNLARLAAALKDLDARIRVEGTDGIPFARDAELLDRVQLLNMVTRYGDFDISFLPSGTNGYEDLVKRAVHVELGTNRVSLASVADIIESKTAAGREKDRRALPVLRTLLQEMERRKEG